MCLATDRRFPCQAHRTAVKRQDAVRPGSHLVEFQKARLQGGEIPNRTPENNLHLAANETVDSSIVSRLAQLADQQVCLTVEELYSNSGDKM